MFVEWRIITNDVPFSVFMFIRLLVYFCVLHLVMMFNLDHCFVVERWLHRNLSWFMIINKISLK